MRAKHKETTRIAPNRLAGLSLLLLAGLATLTALAADPDRGHDARQAARAAILSGQDPGAFVAELRAQAIAGRGATAAATSARPATKTAPGALTRLASGLGAAGPSGDSAGLAKGSMEASLAAEMRLALGEVILLQSRLAEVGEQVKASALPKAVERWAAADADQGQRLRRIESLLRSAIGTADKAADPAASAALRELLQGVAEPPAARVLGVRDLPLAPPDFAPRSLPTTVAEAPSFANSAAAPGGPADLAAGPDTELTEAILAQARELEFEPLRIHDFVRSQIRTEWYAGAQKGATETLRSGAGNDADQASLLIALLHASSMPARYVKGIVEFKIGQLGPMLGLSATDTPAATSVTPAKAGAQLNNPARSATTPTQQQNNVTPAKAGAQPNNPARSATTPTQQQNLAADIGRALAAAGIAAEPVLQGGAIDAFRIEHIFVSAYVPYGNYRGSHVDAGGRAWIPLAPAIKEYQFSPGADALTGAGISAQALTTTWLNTQASGLPLDALRAQAQAWLNTQAGQPLLDSQLQRRTISARPLGVLPASLPGRLVGTVYEATQLAETDQQWLRIRLRADTSADGAIALDQRLRVSDLLGRRLTLSYQPASQDDQDIANAFGSLAYTPAYLVRVRARLMLRGEPDAVSRLDWTPGSLHRLELLGETPAGEVATSQIVLAGGYGAITVGAQAGATPVAALDVPLPNDGEAAAAQRLASLGLRYVGTWDLAENQLADLVGVLPIRPAPSIALSLVDYQVETLLDLPQRLKLRGVALDAALRPTRAIAASEHAGREAEFLRFSSLHGSALEHWIFENDWGAESVSADKGLRLAFQNGIPRFEQTGGTLPASVDLPASIRAEIEAQLARGWRVEGAAGELALNQWQGALWHAEDPTTGASGWFIAGRYAGGATTTPPDQWTIVFDDPNTPGVNEDPLSVRFIEKIASTDNQITEVDTETAEPLAVRVTDKRFRPVQGAEVVFRVSLGEGQIKATEPNAEWGSEVRVTSDISGTAKVGFRAAKTMGLGFSVFLNPGNEQFPTFVGLNKVSAKAVAPVELGGVELDSIDQPITVLARPGVATQLGAQLLRLYLGLLPAGDSGELIVFAKDRFGNGVSNVQVELTSETQLWDNGGSLQCASSDEHGPPLYYYEQECNSSPVATYGACGTSTKTIFTAAVFPPKLRFVTGQDIAATYRAVFSSNGLEPVKVEWGNVCVQEGSNSSFPHAVQTIMTDTFGSPIDATHPQGELGYRRYLRMFQYAPIGEIPPVRYHLVPADPVIGPNITSTGPTGQIAPLQKESAVGLFSTTYRGGAAVEYSGGHLSGEFDVPGPPHAGSFDFQVEGFSTVEFGIREADVEPMQLNAGGILDTDWRLPWQWKRPARNATFLYPLNVYVDFKRDGQPWSGFGAGRRGSDVLEGQADIVFPANIWRFDEVDQHQYTAELVLQKGSPAELRSDPVPLRFGRPILEVFGLDGQSGGSGGGVDAPGIGRFPTSLSMRNTLDFAAGRICGVGTEFVFSLLRTARVEVLAFPKLFDGTQEGSAKTLIAEAEFEAGEHRKPITLADLPWGDYRLQITARDAVSGEEEVHQAALSNSVSMMDSLPLAHSIVQNVDLQDGNLGIARADIDLGGRGPGLRFTRFYSSPRPDRGDFGAMGYGWHTNLESSIQPTGDCGLLVTGADGGAQRFVDSVPGPDGDRIYAALHGYKGTLVQHLDGSFDYFSIDGTRYHYTQPVLDGLVGSFPQTVLTLIEDVDGNRIEYTYARSDIDGELRVIELRDSAGRSLRFDYVAFEEKCMQTIVRPGGSECLGSRRHSVLKRVSGPEGLSVDYVYDTEAGKGMLVAALRGATAGGQCDAASDAPGHCEDYRYTDLGRSQYVLPNAEFATVVHHGLALTGITQRNNGESSFAYDRLFLAQLVFDGTAWVEIRIPSYGVVSETAFDASPWAFAYAPTERGLVTATTTVTDGRGQPTTHTLNRYGAAEQVQDAAGITRTTWDLTHFQPASITDALGRVTSFTYDDYGNKTGETIVGSAGTGTVSRSWTYRPTSAFVVPIKNRAASFVDARGIEENYAYDDRGHLIERRRAGAIESFAYDGRGDRVRQTDFNGGVWAFGFDGFGYPASQSNPLGETARSLYDARGRLQSETDANGNTTTHAYDGSDRRVQSTLLGTGGGTRQTAYADAGRSQTATDEAGQVTVSRFDPLGRLLSVTNALGVTRGIEYDGNGNKVEETDFRGNVTRFVYDDANRLVTTTAPLGKVTTLTVDALGHVLTETITSVIPAKAGTQLEDHTRSTEYEYAHPLYFRTRTTQRGGAGGDRVTEVVPDNAGNPVTTTDALGRVTTRTFDAFERVTRIEEPGRRTELVYDANGNKLSETVSGVDSPARTRRFVYDAANRNTALTDGAGQVSHSAYFPNGEIERRTDARGGTVRFVLDAANRVIESRGPRPEQVTTASYDGVGNRIAERLVNGREITHRYDPLHRLQSSRDSLGEFLRRSYDADGNLTSETDALGATTAYTVNALNQRTVAAAPEGRNQAWTYSVHDEVLSETSPTGAITTHRYDAFGQRIETVLPAGSGADQPRRWSYDLAGNVKTQTDSKGITASFDYDALNRRIRASIAADDGGQAETWRYDARDNAISHRDRAGIEERFSYDGEDRRLTRTRAGSLRESNSYDPNGNLLTQTDANGNVTTFAYDAANQRSSRSIPGASGPETETWTYTASNQIQSHTDAEGQRSSFAYDPRERVIEEVNPENETRHYEYDGNGNRTAIILPNGERWTQGFDQANRLVTVTSPEGVRTRYAYHPDDQLASITDGNGHSVQLQSDALARIRERVYPGGAAFTTQYDGEGNAVQDSRPDSSINRQFDPLNRIKTASYTAIAGNAANIHTTYDPNGNPTTVLLDQDSRNLAIHRSYDDQNRLEREETVAPANAGAQLKTTARSATTVIPAALNSEAGQAGTQSNTPARSATNPSSTSTSTSSSIPQPYTHTQRYALDGNGNRVTVTDAANTTTQQTFDAQNRLLTSTTAGEGSTTTRWNKNGTLQSIDHGNGSTTRYQYDRAQRIQEITHTQNNATTLAFSYDYDQNGNRTQETRTQSAINGQAGSIQTTSYAYDRDDRLIQTTVSHQPSDTSTPDERSDWTLDAVGNRLTETVTRLPDNTTTSNKSYIYSDRDQLTLMTDSINQLSVEYAYDQNGNRTQRTVTKQGQPPETTTYTFDARDRLTGVQPNAPNTANAPSIAYQYDADGRRIERIAFPATGQNPAATLYLYNGSTLLHEAIPDGAANTANASGLRLTDTYRTSAKLDRHLAFDLAGNASVRFYQLDALDTPVAMTDANGNTVTRTSFDAWGNIEQQIAGGVTQPPWQLPNYNPDTTGQAALLTNDGQLIGFTGYQKDSDTGLYYAGARWYDPLTGSFNGMDPAQGNPNSPVSLHRYLYANGNPLIYIDPDGEFAFLQRLADRFGQVATNAQGAANDLNGQLNGSVLGDSFTRLKGIALGVGIKGVAVLGEGLVRTTNFVANSASRQFISDQSDLGRQLDGELDASFQSLDAGVGQGVALAQKVAADPSQGLALAKAGAQGVGRQLSRTFIEGDTGAAAETFSGLPGVLLAPATAGFGGRLLGKAGEALSDLGGKARAKLPRPSVGTPEIGPRDIDLDLDGGIDRGGLPSLAKTAEAPPVAVGNGADGAIGGRVAELPKGGVEVKNKVPTVEFSSSRAPGLKANFDNAVANGAPTQLNRVANTRVRDAKRRAALRGQSPAPAGQSLDEFPFACTTQGGCGSFIRAVPVSEQSYQGGVLSRFFQDNGIKPGDPFNVKFGP